jgi:hypothetical protein
MPSLIFQEKEALELNQGFLFHLYTELPAVMRYNSNKM